MPQEQQRNLRRLRPKLGRSKAIKHADFSTGEGCSDETAVRGIAVAGFEGRRTRSTEVQPTATLASPVSHLSYSSETSFRISGEVDGQFAMLCHSLGVSSAEDFAITPADWLAASKACSSSIGDDDNNCRTDNSGIDASTAAVDNSSFVSRASGSTGAWRRLMFCSKYGPVGRGGIKGTRPSSLTPPPPMSLPTVNKLSSTWDLVWSLAPDDGRDVCAVIYLAEESSSESVEEKETEEEKNGDSLEVNVPHLEDDKQEREGVTCMDITSSCSFWTSNDEDSCSTTTDGISPNIKSKLHIGPGSWTKGKLLGNGSFGSVYEAFTEDGFFFAVKEVSLLDEGPNAQQCIQQLEKEIELLSQFEHENIVQYLGTAKEEATLYIFLEYVTLGSLSSLYQKYELRDPQVSAYTRQILHGLRYLHYRDIIHRDIKCANILVAANGSVKLADFGLAKQTTQSTNLRSSKGTVFWMAPEVANPKGTYGPSADIWSLGCTVLEMLTRHHPFPDLDWIQAIYYIGQGGQPHIPESLSRDARDFIRQCTQVNPEERPSAAKLLDHPFVKRPLLSASSSDSPAHYGYRRNWLQA
ncbi:unnamed protein product [Spirodela intermedia]|uniref:mitogen-activated protein kinase kinase kinase n=1 Tax=Spirodela intermedia TaxID=51605 RepID=A0A7I8J4E7_SPIIN|nr:unnamed protein product [Spirodela intermedia]CAA6664924.1 unnamed protein product [Spirodela intermedia]